MVCGWCQGWAGGTEVPKKLKKRAKAKPEPGQPSNAPSIYIDLAELQLMTNIDTRVQFSVQTIENMKRELKQARPSTARHRWLKAFCEFATEELKELKSVSEDFIKHYKSGDLYNTAATAIAIGGLYERIRRWEHEPLAALGARCVDQGRKGPAIKQSKGTLKTKSALAKKLYQKYRKDNPTSTDRQTFRDIRPQIAKELDIDPPPDSTLRRWLKP